jgi:hypothetical protein
MATKLINDYEANSSMTVNSIYLSHVHGDRAHGKLDNDEASS